MGQLVSIMGKEIAQVVYNGTPVVTLKMVDELHGRNPDTARKRFNENRRRFIEGEDFFDLPYDEWSAMSVRFPDDQSGNSDDQRGGHRGNMIYLSESGYLLLVKSFNDDLSWDMQRALVRLYFAVKSGSIAAAAPRKLIELQENHTTIDKDALIDLQSYKIAYLEGRSRNEFTEEDKQFMREARAAGRSNTEIAEALARPKGSISGWFHRNPCPKGERK